MECTQQLLVPIGRFAKEYRHFLLLRDKDFKTNIAKFNASAAKLFGMISYKQFTALLWHIIKLSSNFYRRP